MLVTGHREKNAAYYDEIYRSGYSTSKYAPLYDLILKTLETIHEPKVLELGCGIGDLGSLIVQKGHPYRGFDFSETAVGHSRRRCPGGSFQLGNVYNAADYQPVDYNTVIALEVLEHVDDMKVMANIPAGARIIASVPDYNDVAHLRLYQDPKRDIVDRFRGLMHTIDVKSIIFKNKATLRNQTIYVFHGIKLVS